VLFIIIAEENIQKKLKKKIRKSVLSNPQGFALNKSGGTHKKVNDILSIFLKYVLLVNPLLRCLKSNKVFCKPECVSLGGYREKSGRGKTGHYKGIYCASTYELCWVIYQLDHGQQVTRFPSYLQNEKVKYYPDFLIQPNLIIEIKVYDLKNKLQDKINLAQDSGYKIQVLFKKGFRIHF